MSLSINRLTIAVSIVIYALLRVFSYYAPPETAWNSFVSGFIALSAAVLIFRRDNRGWLVIAAEIILGGSGNFLSVGSLSLRTVLLVLGVSLFALRYFSEVRRVWQEERMTFIALLLFLGGAALAALHGFVNDHPASLIIADAIPFLFVLYYFPARYLVRQEDFLSWCHQILPIGVLGNLVFTLGTFIVFSLGVHALQDPYYHWFRDIANGKITDLGFNFYRLVLNEHLLTVPLLVFIIGRAIHQSIAPIQLLAKTWLERHAPKLIIGVLTFILALNLTRIYYLALVICLVALFSCHYLRRWLLCSGLVIGLVFGLFTATHTLTSRGQSLGWEIFGLRLQSIASPSLESSSLSRMMLLPKILEAIKKHPLLGDGLGSQVTVYSPVVKQTITTPQFDCRYVLYFWNW
jgi:hypothetical protein